MERTSVHCEPLTGRLMTAQGRFRHPHRSTQYSRAGVASFLGAAKEETDAAAYSVAPSPGDPPPLWARAPDPTSALEPPLARPSAGMVETPPAPRGGTAGTIRARFHGAWPLTASSLTRSVRALRRALGSRTDPLAPWFVEGPRRPSSPRAPGLYGDFPARHGARSGRCRPAGYPWERMHAPRGAQRRSCIRAARPRDELATPRLKGETERTEARASAKRRPPPGPRAMGVQATTVLPPAVIRQRRVDGISYACQH